MRLSIEDLNELGDIQVHALIAAKISGAIIRAPMENGGSGDDVLMLLKDVILSVLATVVPRGMDDEAILGLATHLSVEMKQIRAAMAKMRPS